MTQPDQPAQPTPGPNLQLGLNANVEPGPDGTPWVAVIIDYGISAHKIVVAPEGADQLADALPKILCEAAAAARRARSGLIIAGPGVMPLPPLPDGIRQPNGLRHH